MQLPSLLLGLVPSDARLAESSDAGERGEDKDDEREP